MGLLNMYKKNMAKRKISGSLDTNILLRLLIADVPEQARKAEALIESTYRLDVADAVMIELVFVLEKVYGLSRSTVAANVHVLLRNPKIQCNRRLFTPVMALYESESALSIIDCAALFYARLNKQTPLHSFDKKLVKKSDGDVHIPN